jgi:predicted DNA-binding transcriptional regulator AlpA
VTSRTQKQTILPGQLDLFGAPASDVAAPKPSPVLVRSDVASIEINPEVERRKSKGPKRGRPIKIELTAPPVETNQPAWSPREEWWTTQMVCAFLKISRKTLWERRRTRDLRFPQPVQLGGARNLYRAASVRDWAEKMADAEC